jgi:flagellar protein FlaJ
MEVEERSVKQSLKRILEGESDPKIEAELPFAAMLITLMAYGGISPYESFKRLRKVDNLERFREEGDEIVRLVEVLGYDPLTAIEKRAGSTISRSYADFLEGYVSSVKSGGSVVNYLMSKLRSIFEVKSAKAQNAIERLETLVEAYMVMLIVIFCFYILSAVTSPATQTILGGADLPDLSGIIYPLEFVVIPIFSVFFMYLANNSRQSTLKGIRRPFIAGIIPGAIFLVFFGAIMLIPELSFIKKAIGLPTIVTVGLVSICIPAAIIYHTIAKRNFAAEKAMPSFIRDITEARRTGLSPEKSIVHAASRRGYGAFTPHLRKIINQIEWGISLRKIYEELRNWIKSWPVIVDFFILVETIEIGGGHADTLDVLAEFSEKTQTIEKSQNDMLRPYIILPFIWTVLMAFTVTFTIQILSQIPMIAMGTMAGMNLTPRLITMSGGGVIEAGIIFHSWLSGFFIGKVSEGNFASGFKYAALLALTAFSTLLISKQLEAGFFGGFF